MWKQKKAMRCHQMEGGRTARPVLKQAGESQVKGREGKGREGCEVEGPTCRREDC